jgi:hypothetical protein
MWEEEYAISIYATKRATGVILRVYTTLLSLPYLTRHLHTSKVREEICFVLNRRYSKAITSIPIFIQFLREHSLIALFHPLMTSFLTESG